MIAASLALLGWGMASTVYSATMAHYIRPSLLEPSITCDWGGQSHRVPAVSEIEAGWYPQHWIAAGEPSLFEASQRADARDLRTFRFTWLRSFHKPVIVRVDTLPDGRMRLTAKRLSGAGGYDPGVVEARVVRLLTKTEQQTFEALLAEANDLQLPPIECDTGVDGAQWILEANEAGAYRYVDRWSPTGGPVRRLGDLFLNLTGWKLGPRY